VRRGSDEGWSDDASVDDASEPSRPAPSDRGGRWGQHDDADATDVVVDDTDGRGWDDDSWDDGELDDSASDDSAWDDSAWDDSAWDDSAADDGTWDDGRWDDSSAEDDGWDDESADDGTWDDSAEDDGAWDSGSADDGTWDDSATDDGTWDDSSVDDGSVDDGTWDDSSVDDGSVDDGSWDDEMEGDAGEVTDPATSTDLDDLVADIRGAWTSAVPGTATRVVVVPSGKRVATACADDSTTYAVSDDAFYCDLDDTVVIGADVLAEVQRDYGAGGVAYLLAHEYGHNLQIETGVIDDAPTAKPLELHADCLAGAYVANAVRRGEIATSALDQARAAAYSVGDDAVNDPDHHGTSQERQAAVNLGISGGDCKAYLG
jgi:hypothetical protein